MPLPADIPVDEPSAPQGATCERHLSGRKAVYAAIGTAAFLICLSVVGYWYLRSH